MKKFKLPSLFNTPFIFWSFVFLLYLLLHTPVDSLLLKLSFEVKPNLVSDISFILIIIIYIYSVIYRINENISINPSFIKLIIYPISVWYIVHKLFLKEFFEFNKLSIISLDYFSIFLVVGLGEIIIYYVLKQKNLSPKESKSIFIEDKPWGENSFDNKTGEPDLLDYKNKARVLAEQIIKFYPDKSFTIAITANWGEGKTSFLQMIKSYLKTNSSEIKIVDFSPWKSQNSKQIIIDFFDSISDKLNSFSLLEKKLKSYAKLLANVENRYSGIVSSILSQEESFESYYSQINSLIKTKKIRLVIFIDDIDRLIAREIFEILRLVRNTANFYNTLFIIAFDKKHVIESLDNAKICPNSKLFLEKIFQYEFNLSSSKIDVSTNWLLEKIETEILTDNKKFRFLELKNPVANAKAVPDAFYKLITNLRDAKRLYNSFAFHYTLKENISADYLLIIKLIQLKDDMLYDKLRFYFRNVEENQPDIRRYMLAESKLELSFSKFATEMQVDDTKILRYKKELIEYLFGEFVDKNPYDIIFFGNAYRYFDYPEDKTSIPIEITPEHYESVKDYFEGFSDKSSNQFIKRLNYVAEYVLNQDEYILKPELNFKNYIKLLTYLVGYTVNNLHYEYVEKLLKFNEKQYFQNIENPTDFLKEQLTQFNNYRANYSAGIIQHFLRKYCDNSSLNFILSFVDCQKMAIDNLEYVIANSDDYLEVEYALFACFAEINKENRHVTIMAEAQIKFKEFVEENPKGFIYYLIRPTLADPNGNKNATFMPFVLSIWNNFEEFEQFIESLDENIKRLDLAKKYLAKFNTVQGKEYKDFILEKEDENIFYEGFQAKLQRYPDEDAS